jgi:hypothetical protein
VGGRELVRTLVDVRRARANSELYQRSLTRPSVRPVTVFNHRSTLLGRNNRARDASGRERAFRERAART